MRNLILLHGALGAPQMLEPLAHQMRECYEVHCPAFPGHAGIPGSDYKMSAFADFLENYIHEQRLHRPLVFGYSMGGYAALTLASRKPGLLAAVATLATKLHWTSESAEQEIRMLDPEKIEAKVPAFASALAERHAPLDWKEVLRGTAALMQELGRQPLLDEKAFAAITEPVLLLLGDRDNMVSLEETRKAFTQIAGARFGILPGTAHPIEKTPVELLSTHLHHFFKQCPQ